MRGSPVPNCWGFPRVALIALPKPSLHKTMGDAVSRRLVHTPHADVPTLGQPSNLASHTSLAIVFVCLNLLVCAPQRLPPESNCARSP